MDWINLAQYNKWAVVNKVKNPWVLYNEGNSLTGSETTSLQKRTLFLAVH